MHNKNKPLNVVLTHLHLVMPSPVHKHYPTYIKEV